MCRRSGPNSSGRGWPSAPSIGVTIFHGTQADVGELLKQADLAMYQAKSMGRNTLCFFDPSLQAEMSENARTASDLRDGLRRREFVAVLTRIKGE